MKRTFTEISATDNNDENFEPSQRRPLRLKEDTLSGIMDSVDRDNGGNSSSHLPSQDQEPAVKKVIMIGNNNETKTQGCPTLGHGGEAVSVGKEGGDADEQE